MPVFVTTHDFTHGQLDKSLKARSDLEVYKKGALELKNLVVRAGGAAKTRFGTQFIASETANINEFPPPDNSVVDTAGNPVPPDDYGYQMFQFSPSEHVKLLVILGQAHSVAPPPNPGISNQFTYYVVKNDTGAGPAENTFNTVISPVGPGSWSIDNNQVVRIKYRSAQNQKDFILTTSTQNPLVLTFDETAPTPMIANFLVFRNYPQHDFTRNGYIQSTFSMTLATPLTGNIPITAPGATGPTLTITTLVTTPEFQGFGYTGGTDNHYVGGIVQGLGPLSNTTVGGVTVLSTSVLGVAIIESVTSNTAVNLRVISPFDESFRNGVLGTQIVLTEPAVSGPDLPFPGRGWPRCTVFYENRLLFAGTKNLPQSIFMSRIGNFQDFNVGTGEADDAISYTIASGAEDEIINLVSGRSLEIFTTTSEFAAPVWSESGMTPTTVTIRRQTSIGSANCIPSVIDNMTAYTKRGGRGVLAFQSEVSGGNTFNSTDISALSTEMIDIPIHMTSYVENNAYDANVLLMINRGTTATGKRQMVILESLREQKVSAWTSTETDGEFENCEAVGEEVFFIVKRNVGTPNATYTFERMNWNICLDSAIECTAVVAGLQQPAFPPFPSGPLPAGFFNKTIYVVGYVNNDPRNPEGVWLGTAVVDGAGIATVDIPETPNPPDGPGPISPANPYYYWIGLPFEQRLETMPLDVPSQQGNILYRKKKIFKAYVQYLDSYPFFVNGIEARLRNLAVPPPAIPPGLQLNVREKPYSGVWMAPTMQKLNIDQNYYVGWTREATVLITTTRPLPLTIQGITAGAG